MKNTIDYQFTPVPTQLFMCCDNNCRSLLFSLIQLSTYYASKNPDGFDGWFFRSNHSLEAESQLSKNVLCGALEALYIKGVVDVKPQERGKGKKQDTRQYRIKEEVFKQYEQLSLDDCIENPLYAINTMDYKRKGSPMFQTLPKLILDFEFGKSDNNIDYIDKTDIENIINNIDCIDIINNKQKFCKYLETSYL